ncbi:MAG: ribosome small subunit-dependent GTPase A [Hyphomicrobiaceae bacterium]
MTLATFGWTAERQHAFASHAAEGLIPGRVVGEHRTHYQVATDHGELSATAPGRVRHAAATHADLPGVGDFVALRPAPSDGPATIEAVLPRTSALIRKASGKETPQLLASNVDVVFIVTGLDGDYNLARIQRFLTLVRDSGARAVIIANKTDRASDLAAIIAEVTAAAPDVPVHAVSARAGQGIAELTAYFADNQTITLVGSSGVGKSTLINKLLGREAQATQEVRSHDSRGRHTTTHRQLFLRPGGGAIIDTPGMRGLESWEPTAVEDTSFEDIEALALQCKFSNCRHQTEPACAVRAAIAAGTVTADRVQQFTANAARTPRSR